MGFPEMRMNDFWRWCSNQEIPGIRRGTFKGVFKFLLSKQNRFGTWEGDGNRWEVVQTAVVLKSLAKLQFGTEASWEFTYNGVIVPGSVRSALNFIEQQLTNHDTDRVGEDIWDACEALLAVAAFDRKDIGRDHAITISKDWADLYKQACCTGIRWCGPAYLAAMIDVMVQYRDIIQEDNAAFDLDGMIQQLLSLEEQLNGQPTGTFRASDPSRDMDRWTTSLVLRTLCDTPSPPLGVIDRCAAHLIEEVKSPTLKANLAEAPMYLARCLEGLTSADRLVGSKRRVEIGNTLVRGNKLLDSFWADGAQRMVGNVKSYTAVGEYLASLKFAVPASLIFDLPSPGRESPREEGQEPRMFVVHGRDMGLVRDLQHYVRNTLGLEEPVSLGDVSQVGATILEEFEKYAASASFVFVLLTPDDLGGLQGQQMHKRARQNVLFEMGYFLGKLGRTSGRVLLLSKGRLEMASDLGGVVFIDVSGGIKAAGEDIRRALARAGVSYATGAA